MNDLDNCEKCSNYMADCNKCSSKSICSECKNDKFLDTSKNKCITSCLSDDTNSYLLIIKNKNNKIFY